MRTLLLGLWGLAAVPAAWRVPAELAVKLGR
jgi:hypothetical protein